MAKRKRSKPETAETSPAVEAAAAEPEPAFIEPETEAEAVAPQSFDEPALGEVVVVPPAMAAHVGPEAPAPMGTAEPNNAPAPDPQLQPMLGKNWFALRAAAIAFLAALGGAAGSLAPYWFDQTPAVAEAIAAIPDQSITLQVSVAKLAAEVAALRSAVVAAEKSAGAGLAAVSERLDTSETMQGALVERVTRIAENFAAQPKAVAASDITGSITPTEPQIAQGWTLWRVYRGRALVEGRGTYFEVMPGSDLPGLGTVERIARSDGRWVVVTSRGIIVPADG